jgi:hypothetical protein
MSDEELKQELLSLWESIFLSDCYGLNDLIRFLVVKDELERRGYKLMEKRILVIRKVKSRNSL